MAKEVTFTLLTYSVGQEKTIDEKTYSNTITIGIETSNPIIKPFSVDIEVICSNDLTGFEVDQLRQNEINNYINTLNI